MLSAHLLLSSAALAVLLLVAILLPHGQTLARPERKVLTFRPGPEHWPSSSVDDSEQDLNRRPSPVASPPDGPTLTLAARPTTVYRPRSLEALQNARRRSQQHLQSEHVEWVRVNTIGPDIEDQHTIAQLGRMTGNAYALPGRPNWYDIDPAWNHVRTFRSLRQP